MCCIFSSRKKPAACVFILSALAFACGVMMIVFAAKLNQSEFMDKLGELEDIDKDIDFNNMRNVVFGALVAFALLAIIAACMGMVACKVKHRLFTICYGTCLLPIWIAVLVVGGIATYISTEGKEKIQEECSNVIVKLNE